MYYLCRGLILYLNRTCSCPRNKEEYEALLLRLDREGFSWDDQAKVLDELRITTIRHFEHLTESDLSYIGVDIDACRDRAMLTDPTFTPTSFAADGTAQWNAMKEAGEIDDRGRPKGHRNFGKTGPSCGGFCGPGGGPGGGGGCGGGGCGGGGGG